MHLMYHARARGLQPRWHSGGQGLDPSAGATSCWSKLIPGQSVAGVDWPARQRRHIPHRHVWLVGWLLTSWATSRTAVTADLQSGQTACFFSHSSIHCWWNVWPHRSVRTVSVLQNSDRQTQQLSDGSIGTHTPEFSASAGAVPTTEDPSDCSAAAVSPEILGVVMAGPDSPMLSVAP